MSQRFFLQEYLCICRDEDCPLPIGICHCGCGGKVTIAKQSAARDGSIKGQPNRYLRGHAYGRQTDEVKREQCSIRSSKPEEYPGGFYVYTYLRERRSIHGSHKSPYYIGKGIGYRAWIETGRNIRRPENHKYIKIVASGMSEKDAFQLEMMLIFLYGRIDLSTGCLQNMTDGGEGNSNRSEEQRRRCSEAQKARWANKDLRPRLLKAIKGNNYGRKHSLETKEKLRMIQCSRALENPKGPVSEETRRKMSIARLEWVKSHQPVTRRLNHGTARLRFAGIV